MTDNNDAPAPQEPPMISDEKIEKITFVIQKALLADITDRRGWRQEWDMMDADIQHEIKREHRRIIREELKRLRAKENGE